ncbi:MAG: hypothetical protein OXF52_00515 [Candidatus Dadabacteria bacterium]|nr:hypothetical protein [Candidatus Dadabacteria bacterium]MCY4043119.1 hypothetical protein [Candidatus Dadabacteria bacterium]
MGLIRNVRDKSDPWGARLEKQRKTRHPDAKSGPEDEGEILRRRRMFGKVFSPKPLK